MPRLLRLCLAGLLLLAISSELSAQRTGRRRGGGGTYNPAPEFTLVKITREAKTPAQKLQEHMNRVKEIIDTRGPAQSAAIRDEYSSDYMMTFEMPALKEIEEPITEDDTEAPTIPVDCRETKPINKQNIADAYPWISADGLRLYFSSSRNVHFSRIHVSTRASVEDEFDEPKILSSRVPEGFVGAAFTPDELTMIVAGGGKLYISIRKDRSAEFPVPVKAEGIPDHFHMGPSFSPDGKEIIATTKKGSKYSIHRYLRTGTYTFEDAGTIEIKEEGEPGPGQLSKDGLSYYFSLETKTSEQLWRLTRSALGQPFEKNEALNSALPAWATSLRNNLQPSVNGDGSILVFVTSASKTWTDDEIALVNLAKPATPGPKPSIAGKEAIGEKIAIKVNAYPNPFNTAFTIELPETPSNGVTITVYDINGKLVKQQRTSNKLTQVELTKVTAGIYIYSVATPEGKVVSTGKMIKTN